MMLDKLTEIPFLKSIGISGIIAVIVSIIPLLGKMGIVTSITSSKVEKVLFSKEKRFYIAFFQFILLYIFSLIFTTYFTLLLSEVEFTIHWVVGVSIVAIVSFIAVAVVIIIPEANLYKFGKKVLISSFVFLAMHILCLFLITPFIIIATLYETGLTQTEIQSVFNEPVKYQILVLPLLVIIVISNLLFLTLSYFTTKQFLKKFNVERYYIIDTGNINFKWFIYHPVDKEHILLGNDAVLECATEFKIEETKKIITEKIYYYIKPRSSAGKIKKKKTRPKEQTSIRRINNNGSFAQTGRIHRNL